MEEVILRTVAIQFDGRVVEVFTVHYSVRVHVALMPKPEIGKPNRRGRTKIGLGTSFGVDADEMPKLRPLLDKITAAILTAQAERR